jgi:hypothetical protein
MPELCDHVILRPRCDEFQENFSPKKILQEHQKFRVLFSYQRRMFRVLSATIVSLTKLIYREF